MLQDLLISEVRVKILSTMLPDPSKPYHVRALVRAVDTEINAVRRELKRLTGIGLLRKRPSGNRLYYSVNTDSIYYPELLSLISKEEGLGKEILTKRKEIGNIKFAMLSRAFARGRPHSMLDVDLFIVGEVNADVLKNLIDTFQKSANREVNYTIMGNDEFMFRKRRNDQFVSRILIQSRIMLIGDEEEFCSLIFS